MAFSPKTLCLSALVCFAFGFWSAIVAAQANYSVNLDNASEQIRVVDPDYLVVSGIHSIDEVTTGQFANNWKPFSQKKDLALGKDPAIWFRFSINPITIRNNSWSVSAVWPLLEHVQMFVHNQITNEWTASRPVGTNYPVSERYHSQLYFDFPVDIENNQPLVVYLNIKSNNLLSVPIFVSSNKALVSHYAIDNIIIGTLFGALLIMFFYNICLFFLLTDKSYLYYSLYILCVVVYELHITGLGIKLFWDSNDLVKNHSLSLVACLTFIASTLFIQEFLELRKRGRIISSINISVLCVWSAVAVLHIFYADEAWVKLTLNIVALGTCLVAIAFAVYLILIKETIAKVFLFAWGVLVLGTCVFVMALYGQIPLTLFSRYAQMVGFVLELVLLSFALAYRINDHKRKREIAQERALDLAEAMNLERNERIKAQLETLDVHKKLNDELEGQVKLRTQQLEDAMAKLQGANSELTELSVTDTLTSVHNRRYFDDAFVLEYKRAHRNEQSVAVILIDIDHFKAVNDNYGHSVGDDCIRLVAQALQKSIRRPGDVVARYGGEEFIMLLSNCDLGSALSIAEASRKAIENVRFFHEEQHIHLSVSAGVAAWIPATDSNHKQLINAADVALYQAKNAGRNRVTASELATKAS